MKKYPIKFTNDFADYENWLNGEYVKSEYFNINSFPDKENQLKWGKKYLLKNKEKLELCKKWKGKSLTIYELEKNIAEFGEVVFDGETIEIYNDFRE